MEYRQESGTGKIYTYQTFYDTYIGSICDAGIIKSSWDNLPIVTVVYDSAVDTNMHIKRVAQLLTNAAAELIRRANIHDASKLENPEKEQFDVYTPKLKSVTYGSEDYMKFMSQLNVALDHHYANNSHHPQHYKNGINGFDLFDLVEMFFDWKAATERHGDGDIYKSIEINKTRFNMSEQLCDIFTNTASRLNYEK